jgi:protocatechuate 3,4-dioxygenase beta subunit
MKNRRDFLKFSGLASAATLLPFTKLLASNEASVCTLMPSDDEGPFPYPGGEITNPLNIVDIRGGQTGVQLDLTLTVVDAASCAPLDNVRVDIWHCNKDGDYSGYAGFVGQFWLRGYQLTNSNGQAFFTTIYPGWYPGRATHIHMEFFYNNVLKLHTQMAFDESISNVVHVSALYAANGVNPTTNAQDGILGNTPADLILETAAVTGSVSTGYAGALTIGLSGITGINEKANGLENISAYPNPVTDQVVVSHPVADSNTTVKVMSLEGKILAKGILNPGATITNVDVRSVPNGVYILVVEKVGQKHIMKFVKM